MHEFLYELYDTLYTPLAMTKQKAEIYECHHKLVEVLDKPERKLLLTIMDIKDKITDELAFDSFVCGFNLALRLSSELRLYEETPLDRSKTFDDSVVSAMFGDNQGTET